MRWVCFGVLIALVLFVFILFRVTFTQAFFKPAQVLPETRFTHKPPQWESFPFLNRYYGGLKSLVSKEDNIPEYPPDETSAFNPNKTKIHSTPPSSSPFNPYPDYASKAYVEKYGTKVECFLDADRKISIPQVRTYNGTPDGFPDAAFGSSEMLGIREDVCFDRFGRLGPYGLGYGVKAGGTGAGLEGDRSGIEDIWEEVPPVNFKEVNWAEVQERCISDNIHRFPKLPSSQAGHFKMPPVGAGPRDPQNEPTSKSDDTRQNITIGAEQLPRTAFIIRTWVDFEYTEETIVYLRSLISELTVASGGEYVVHFLVHVKDENLPIWSDDETYDRVLKDALPKEFWGMGTLWSERQMALVYGGLDDNNSRNLPVYGVYRSTFMPVQYFAYQHPEYDFYWNWEMDARYTGHWYHLFDKVGSWAKKQPRKGLWERNSRFYVPSVHGSWEDFRQMVRVQTEQGTNSMNNMWSAPNKGHRPNELQPDKPIWGPERPQSEEDVLETEGEGIPPRSYEKDKYEWGVGEDADLIVFNPLFDPEGTTWLLRDDATGYNKDNGTLPRRTAIITASRLSRKLLHTMHRETSLKRHTMFSEMWPASTCLHHGFKATFAPHSVYIDRQWPTTYLEAVYNAGRNGASGGARTSIFGDREHNFRGTTWFYSAGHSISIWRRWLGYRSNNDGGEEYELANEGRMCVPPMLLHPVKEVKMVIQAPPGWMSAPSR